MGVVFIESVCTEPEVLQANLMMKLKLSPDYAKLDQEKARADLEERINHYAEVYEPLEEETVCVKLRPPPDAAAPVDVVSDSVDSRSQPPSTHQPTSALLSISYIRLLNLSMHVTAHNIWGRAAVNVLPYLMALHVGSRPIFLCKVEDEMKN